MYRSSYLLPAGMRWRPASEIFFGVMYSTGYAAASPVASLYSPFGTYGSTNGLKNLPKIRQYINKDLQCMILAFTHKTTKNKAAKRRQNFAMGEAKRNPWNNKTKEYPVLKGGKK